MILALATSASLADDHGTWNVELVSLSSDGRQGDDFSVRPEISADGRFIAFVSMASNFDDSGAADFGLDVYLRDRDAGTTSLVSVGGSGRALMTAADQTVSSEGRRIAFASNAEGGRAVRQIYLRDLDEGSLELVSEDTDGAMGVRDSATPSVSDNGELVAFASSAPRLALGCVGGVSSVYVRNMRTGATMCATRTVDGCAPDGDSGQPAISGDGRFVVFNSTASNLVEGDDNGHSDIFLYDMLTADLTLISRGIDGLPANGDSIQASVSFDGARVVYVSEARNLVRAGASGVGHIFLWERETATTRIVSVNSAGEPADRLSAQPRISRNGERVAFLSPALTLLPGQANGRQQIYVRDLEHETTTLVSRAIGGGPANGNSFQPAISSDGSVVAFRSNASDLVTDDRNGTDDVFVATERMPGGRERVRVRTRAGGGSMLGGASDGAERSN